MIVQCKVKVNKQYLKDNSKEELSEIMKYAVSFCWKSFYQFPTLFNPILGPSDVYVGWGDG